MSPNGARLLAAVAFLLGAVLAVSAAITAMAPYLAVLIVLGLVWLWVSEKDEDDGTKGKDLEE